MGAPRLAFLHMNSQSASVRADRMEREPSEWSRVKFISEIIKLELKPGLTRSLQFRLHCCLSVYSFVTWQIVLSFVCKLGEPSDWRQRWAELVGFKNEAEA